MSITHSNQDHGYHCYSGRHKLKWIILRLNLFAGVPKARNQSAPMDQGYDETLPPIELVPTSNVFPIKTSGVAGPALPAVLSYSIALVPTALPMMICRQALG